MFERSKIKEFGLQLRHLADDLDAGVVITLLPGRIEVCMFRNDDLDVEVSTEIEGRGSLDKLEELPVEAGSATFDALLSKAEADPRLKGKFIPGPQTFTLDEIMEVLPSSATVSTDDGGLVLDLAIPDPPGPEPSVKDAAERNVEILEHINTRARYVARYAARMKNHLKANGFLDNEEQLHLVAESLENTDWLDGLLSG